MSNLAIFFGSWMGTTTGTVNKYLDVKMFTEEDRKMEQSDDTWGLTYGYAVIANQPKQKILFTRA